ncbi:hypothetical protein FJV41_14090 [Myxococcus llanfairpwllgwyngyllgogerychwyrndrobwllllantysiliogogogochensis]|uniref:Uncharacterized protein n=2 Tax=Myxococcus llanfairpwllgwyngyllgogerychwyrndrobwllllantysiliogogogochensis TaxID=2590453 RepID=A0A540X201_9BACT|nr:hypothetical protein FJV41_14090 [Myxococcus llanfairpwllgwyngyllgogerychwyrndrobwllllantysiliogogogochensis]
MSFLPGTMCVVWLAGCGGGASPVERDSQATGQTLLADDAVLVTRTTRFYTSVGIAERAEDLSENPPEIHVYDGARFSRITGSAVPGGWRFMGVPRGEYYLRSDSGTRVDILTSARHVDLGVGSRGRLDAVYAGVDWSPARLDLRNLSPWVPVTGDYQRGSSLQVVSSQLDLSGSLLLFKDVPEGATSIVTDEAEMLSFGRSGIPVFQSDQGDRLYVNQLSEFIAGGMPDGTRVGYSAVDRSVELEPIDFAPDWETPMPITGVLQPLEPREVTLDWRLSEFSRLAVEGHPRASLVLSYLEIRPAPHSPADGWFGHAGELLSMSLPPGAATDFTGRLRFGNPYPSDWGVVGRLAQSYAYPSPLPSNPASSVQLTGHYFAIDVLENLTSGPVVPRLSPPRSLRIDRKQASSSNEVGSLHPVISWVPPAVGKPTGYEVRVTRIHPRLGLTLNMGNIYVPGSVRELRLPPGKLERGTYNFVKVTAIEAPHWDVEHAPLRTLESVPYHSAAAFGSLFFVP